MLEEFTRFLPESLAPHSAAQLIRSQAQRYDDRRGSGPPAVRRMLLDKVWCWTIGYIFPDLLFLSRHFMSLVSLIIYVFNHQDRRRGERAVAYRGDRDHSVDRSDLNDDKAMVKMHRDPRKRVEKENRERRRRDLDDGEAAQDNLHHFQEKRKSSRKTEGFEADSGHASHSEKNNLKGKRLLVNGELAPFLLSTFSRYYHVLFSETFTI